ncbi:MAG TPA: bifunctional phosphoglucose/phosphomannose isomerase [Chitinophagales bacterium]|nr:bifunctional phosphoglucose/phosphomannose isomerase [Chitinophagales bacterium]
MDYLIAGFTQQLREAIAIGKGSEITPPNFPITSVVVTGLGGSGIGGNLVAEFVSDELRIPFEVNKDYFLPNYVNKNTLVIASSYSGNTEETLSALTIALKRKAKIVCISSGGRLIEMARQYGLDHIIVPGGNPPRASLGYSLVQQLYVLHSLQIIPNQFEFDLNCAIALLDAEEDNMRHEAKEIASRLKGKIPIIYVTTPMASVGLRFRQQINENSKMLCWHHVIPEMNHNELVGWRTQSDKWAVIFLRNENDYPRNQQRIEINKEIIGRYCETIIEIFSKGNSHIERALYLIHLTDWVSFYLAEIRNTDAMEVEVIDFLKNSLAKQPMT